MTSASARRSTPGIAGIFAWITLLDFSSTPCTSSVATIRKGLRFCRAAPDSFATSASPAGDGTFFPQASTATFVPGFAKARAWKRYSPSGRRR